ncbi:MAG: hypothetical protein ABL900_19705 [Burkholderiaceae bacterium]
MAVAGALFNLAAAASRLGYVFVFAIAAALALGVALLASRAFA